MPQPGVPEGVDHLLYAVGDLEAGRDEVERMLGARPVLGGRHPRYGTHNALLSLGPATYLEVIAPDPGLAVPERGVLLGGDRHAAGRLATWVLRSESIDDVFADGRAAAAGLGPIESGSRESPGGTSLTWKLSDPYALPLDGAVPFLISWGSTPHPAASAPRPGVLVGLGIEHPEPERVRRALSALGVEMDVREGSRFQLAARVRVANGEVELR